MTLPPAYKWLEQVPVLPLMVAEGLKTLGTVETPGAGNNPVLLGWASEVGLKATYTADEIPWCGLWVAVIAQRASKPVVASPLWALSWATFGQDGGQPELGDILTFQRPGGGHVALYIGEDASAYHVLGGNQSDKVCFARIEKKRLYRCRQPAYTVKPASARPYILGASGALSRNEA